MLYLVEMHPSGAVNVDAVQEIMNQQKNWYRFAPTSWVVVTRPNVGARTLRDQLRPLLPEVAGKLFVIKLDPSDREGWMPRKFWDWLRQWVG
jgi:hypothetical protein